MKRSLLIFSLLSASLCAPLSAEVADKIVREKISGIDVIAYKTGVKDVVTFRGSFPAGDVFAPKTNVAIPTLVGEMLDKGTTKQDKFAIAQKLDNLGAKIDFSVEGVMLDFGGKCLSKDLPVVMSLLAEQLRMPKFSEEEFSKLKKQIVGQLQRAMESTDFRADQAFAETVFAPGNPNYSPPTKEFVAAVQAAKLEDLKTFHAAFYGPAQATLVAVGDVDIAALKSEIGRAFEGWSGGKTLPEFSPTKVATQKREETIAMADKPNVTVLIGQSSGLRYRDPDELALRVGTAVLGSGFTGRLMSNVRDKEGLTYGIGAGISGTSDTFADGDWRIGASFAPQLLEQGMASTKRQLDSWYNQGITAAELERVKTNLIGNFKVGLATTDGLAGTLLNAIQRGYDVTWLDEYPKRISALSLGDVNAAIKKHLQPENMTIIKAGTVPAPADRG